LERWTALPWADMLHEGSISNVTPIGQKLGHMLANPIPFEILDNEFFLEMEASAVSR